MFGSLASVIWDVSPYMFNIELPDGWWFEAISPRWYSVLFASGLIVGQYLMAKVYVREGKPMADIDALTIYVVVGTVVGARLGHCLFYEPERYLADLDAMLSILRVWEGGLASHGGAIGILIAIYLYCRKRADQPMLWVLDRLVIFVCLGGAFIRLGNLMNSEIYGMPTDLPWGFVFVNSRSAGEIARHPTQIYEAIWCLLMFVGLYRFYYKSDTKFANGTIFGWFLIVLFAFRFGVEYLKEAQISIDELGSRWFYNLLSINTGQALSLPFIAAGAYILYLAKGGKTGHGSPEAKPAKQANRKAVPNKR